jgi:hypothetical protein
MSDWLIARHQVAIAGSVRDGKTGKPIAGARVEMTVMPVQLERWLVLHARCHGAAWPAMSERLDRTRTAADGHFHFVDLPDGDYTLTASLPAAGSRYGAAGLSLEVTRDSNGNLIPVTADMVLPPTTLSGTITAGNENDPVVMAEVQIQGSGERTFSNSDGSYVLSGLEQGERSLVVSARDYATATQQVVLSAGDEVITNLILQAPS